MKGFFLCNVAASVRTYGHFFSRRIEKVFKHNIDEAVWALSWMHGEVKRTATLADSGGVAKASSLQTATQRRFEILCFDAPREDRAVEPEAALTSLLEGRSVYAEASLTTTAAFKNALVSLPTDVRNGPYSSELLPVPVSDFLERFEAKMLRTLAEVQVDRELRGVPNTSSDPVSKNSQTKYAASVRRCAKIGMLSYPAKRI